MEVLTREAFLHTDYFEGNGCGSGSGSGSPFGSGLDHVLNMALFLVWGVDMARAPAPSPATDAAVVTSPALAVTTAPVAVMILAME